MKGRSLVLPLGILAFVAVIAVTRMADPNLPPPGPTWGGVDLNIYFAPSLSFLRRSILQGEFPLWNPHAMVGTPFVALHSPGALYPLLLPFIVFPPHLTLTIHALLHLFLAGLFTALFLRRLGVGRAGAISGGIAFAGSAPVVVALHNPAYLATFAWLPGTFWAVECAVRRPSLRSSVGLAVALAMAFLAGHAQGFLYLGQSAALYAIFRTLQSTSRPALPRVAAVLAGGGVVALGLIAIQLLASVDHAADAARSLEGMSLRGAGQYPQPLASLVSGLAGVGKGWANLPMLVLPLTLAALIRRQLRWQAGFFVALAALTLDFMRGPHGLVFPAYFDLPGGNLFRIPLRIAFVYQFAAAALLGIGLQALLSWLERRRTLLGVAAVLVPAVIAANVYLKNPLPYRYDPIVRPEILYEPRSLAALGESLGYDRIFLQRLRTHQVPAKFGTLHGLFTVPDYDPILPGSYARFFGISASNVWHGQLDVLEVPRTRHVSRQPVELLDLLSVRYYVDGTPPGRARRIPTAWAELPVHMLRKRPTPLYVRLSALPRAYVVHDVVVAEGEEEALALVRGGRFDARVQVVSVGPIEGLVPPPAAAREFARIAAYGPNRVELEAHCASRCLVVLTDLFDPSWEAEVDGSETRVRRVNYLVRGVPMEPGTHRITFRYRPRALRLGVPITLATLAALLIALSWDWRWRRGQRIEPCEPTRASSAADRPDRAC